MTRFWASTGSLEMSVWYFTPDGRVFEGVKSGFSQDDLGDDGGKQGRGERSGNELVVTWSDGRVVRSVLEESGKGFSWNGGVFTPVKAFGAASEVVGKWEGGDSASGTGTRVAASRSLELRPDGTFSRSSTSSVSSVGRNASARASGSSSSGGRWKLEGFSLQLTDPGGQVTRGVAFPHDDPATAVDPDRMYFNGTMYKRL